MNSPTLEAPELSPSATLHERFVSALQVLAERPWLLFCVACCVNTIHLPYLGLMHDARLYAVQTLNRATDGQFSQDLFLCYGSQDQYSLFSSIASPLTRAVGLPVAFFLIYLVSIALYLSGCVRLLLRLFGPAPWVAMAVLILAFEPVAYGGMGIFHINEPFTTPRLPACGLVLWGIVFLLSSQWILGTVSILLALAIHPLMALAGLSMLLSWIVLTVFPQRGLYLLAGASLGGLALLALLPDIGYRFFIKMDAEWMERVRLASPFNFTREWEAITWLRVGLSLLVVLLSARLWQQVNQHTAGFLRLIALIGFAGLLATTLAGLCGFTLLLQAQPYRMLWVAHLLTIPCGLHLLLHVWKERDEIHRSAVVFVLGFLLLLSCRFETLALALLVLPLWIVGLRGFLAAPRTPNWCSLALAFSFVSAALLSGLSSTVILFQHGHEIVAQFEAIAIVYVAVVSLGMTFYLLFVSGLLTLIATDLRRRPGGVAWAALLLAITLQAGCFAFTQTQWYQHHLGNNRESMRFMAQILASQKHGARTPTVYWPRVSFDAVARRLNACAYFEFSQMSGLLFSKDTAAESARRVQRIGPFELQLFAGKDHHFIQFAQHAIVQMTGREVDGPAPTREDLLHLAGDLILDYVVLREDLGVPILATDGCIYVYDCAQLRSLSSSQGK